MSQDPKFYKIKITTADGRELIWRKGGQDSLLPESLADTWVAKFKPEIWEITPGGEMVGVGRSSEPALKILRWEKVEA